MNKYRLSTKQERIMALLLSSILVLCMILVLVLLRKDTASFIICMLASVLVSAGLLFYVKNLFRAACIPHQEDVLLEVLGYPDSVVFLAGTVCLETAPVKNGPMTARTLIFTDADGAVTASVPTFFSSNQGAQAEPLAMELARELGISFKASLEPWEYDKEKRREREKALALAKKDARRNRLRALKAKLLGRSGPDRSAPAASEEASVSWAEENIASDGINYDALDDEK